MAQECGKKVTGGGRCGAPPPSCCPGDSRPAAEEECPLTHFGRMIDNCYDYAVAAKKQGRPIVGIMCEYTPRELILAAGAVPVCLCGGAADTIPAAEQVLPANLCPLIKSTFGYHLEKSNPFLEMADLVVAETTCDGKKKMYELMAQSRPMYVLELPQKPLDADARLHWRRELEKFRAHLRQQFGTEICDERLREAIGLMNRERSLRRQLAELMRADRPPLTGRELLDLKSSISGIPADLAQYERALAMLGGQQGRPDLASRVRVLLTGVPLVHGAERVLEIIEGCGGLVVSMENCTGVKPVLQDVQADDGDLIGALADKYIHLPCSVMTGTDGRLESLAKLAGDYRAQCVIDLAWQACLTYDVESARVRRFVEESLRLPYLRISTDYSPSDSSRIATRVEAMFETLRARRSGSGQGGCG